MNINEMCIAIQEDGLKLSLEVLSKMGLKPGDKVYLSYLSNEEQTNTYQEFLITNEGFQKASKQNEKYITIPNELLNSAGMDWNTEITIYCLDNIIIICQENKPLAELRETLIKLSFFNKEMEDLLKKYDS